MTIGKDILDQIVDGVASELEQAARLGNLGDRSTSGPAPQHPAEHPIVEPTTVVETPTWANGWWTYANSHRPAHPGRIGGPIRPFAVVVHTTDMLPDELPALLRQWTISPGAGNAAHFVIAPSEADGGVIQVVPVDHNANHAGGEGHGVFVDERGTSYHPNLASVGIELHCAGGVRWVGGQWRLVEDGKAHGAPVPDDQVTPDPSRPGRGWHHPTAYQYRRLGQLLDDLELVLAPLPAGTEALSVVERTPIWGIMPTARVVGHVTLDTANRSDPWPLIMQWLRDRGR